jgi:hypothetical protein
MAVHGGDAAGHVPEVANPRPGPSSNSNSDGANTAGPFQQPATQTTATPILTETDAMFQFYVIPLYFPRSFALVKPYVKGFELSSLDAPNLTAMEIDTGWQPVAK